VIEMIFDFLKTVYKSLHAKQNTYPTLADSIVLTSGVGDWELGSLVEVIPANFVCYPFEINFVGIGEASATGAVYEIELFAGAVGSELEIGQCRAYRQANQSGSSPSPMSTPIQPKGTRISARCAVEDGGSETIKIALFYKLLE